MDGYKIKEYTTLFSLSHLVRAAETMKMKNMKIVYLNRLIVSSPH